MRFAPSCLDSTCSFSEPRAFLLLAPKVYSLTQALRQRHVDHYVLRACPDGEGDWSFESNPETVREIQVKLPFTETFAQWIASDLDRRHLPLLVDVGGRPGPFDGPIFDQCTQAILLAPSASSLEQWRTWMTEHSIPILAEIQSVQAPEPSSVITENGLVLRGIASGLEHGQVAHGPLVEAILDRLQTLFAYSPVELRAAHLATAPVETVIELDRLGDTLGLLDSHGNWSPDDLPRVIEYLPAHTPLAVYGRGPIWLYTAIANHALPADFAQFDPRLGWVTPPTLPFGLPPENSPLRTSLTLGTNYALLELTLSQGYLDYFSSIDLIIPPPPPETGLVISGKLPMWLWTALCRSYWMAPWLAVFSPRENQAVVIFSRLAILPLGQRLPLEL